MRTFVILCGGSGKRTQLKYNKIFHPLNNQETVLEHLFNKIKNSQLFDEIIIVYNKNDLSQIKEYLHKELNNQNLILVEGGKERYNSVYNAVNKSSNNNIFIHDGARPFISINKIEEMIEEIETNENIDCLGLGIDVIDTINIVKNNKLIKNLNRSELKAMQTPQVIKKNIYLNIANDKEYTDETSLFLNNNKNVKIIEGEITNYKITTKEDILSL